MIRLKKKTTAIILLITIPLISLGAFAFVNLGKWLVVSNPLPEKLDVIFVFGGKGRHEFALKIAQNHPESIIAFNHIYVEEIRNFLIEGGVDSNKIIGVYVRNGTFLNLPIDTFSTGTCLELSFLLNWLKKSKQMGEFLFPSTQTSHHITDTSHITVALVSDGFHMRRIQFLINRFHPEKTFNFIFVPVPLNMSTIKNASYDRWWQNKKLRALVLADILKTVYSFFVYWKC